MSEDATSTPRETAGLSVNSQAAVPEQIKARPSETAGAHSRARGQGHPRPHKSANTAYWLTVSFGFLYFAVILAYFVWLLFSAATINGQRATVAILLVGIGITTLCAVIWAGHVIGIRSISRATAAAIWTAMIASILATSATVYKGILVSPPHVGIEKFMLLDESEVIEDKPQHFSLKDLKPKPNSDYNIQDASSDKTRDVTIAVAVVVWRFDRDSVGKYDVHGEISLVSTEDDLQDAGELPITTKDDDFEQRPIIQNLTLPKVTAFLGPLKDKCVYIQVLRKFNPSIIKPGPKELRVRIKDNLNHTYDEASQRVTFRN